MTNDDLITLLIDDGALKTPRIIDAFRVIDRAKFVPAGLQEHVYANIPLPLGHGATISQPYTVAVMLELLQPQVGERCLDIGAGSGWTAALLGSIVGPAGRVVAVERIPQLAIAARQSITAAGLTNVQYHVGDASRGWASDAPYGVIHVAAAARVVPPPFVEQLAAAGRLVIPVGEYVQDLVLMTKMEDNTVTERRLPGFQFVPLISQQS
ncbi:MAG: protein-L-isoaspartate O-methyltransferase [Patescibacteria group bacterium]